MNPIFRFLLTRIALLAMVNYAANAQADAPQAGVVLEASEIYSSTVEVGDFVVVVYGREKRQPISGTQARLDTARGYIKAVNQRRLIVGLEPDGWSKWIALNRIQALVLVGSPSPDAIARASALATAAVEAATVAAPFLTSADRNSTQTNVAVDSATVAAPPLRSANQDSTSTTRRIIGKLIMGGLPSGRADNGLTETPDTLYGILYIRDDMGPGGRIARKLAVSALGGLGGGLLGSLLGVVLGHNFLGGRNCSGDQSCGLAAAYGVLFGGSVGYSVGTAVGVSLLDPHDRFIMALVGSLLGLGGGVILADAEDLWPSIFVGPAILATWMSELSRSPPKARRFSVGLVPNPKRGLSAIATLRF